MQSHKIQYEITWEEKGKDRRQEVFQYSQVEERRHRQGGG